MQDNWCHKARAMVHTLEHHIHYTLHAVVLKTVYCRLPLVYSHLYDVKALRYGPTTGKYTTRHVKFNS